MSETHIINDPVLGLDFIWNGQGLTVNIYHENNHNTVLDNCGMSEPTLREFRRVVKNRINDLRKYED